MKIDWDRISRGVERERQRMIWRPYGAPDVLDLSHSRLHDGPISEVWDIPQSMIVSVAITGAFIRHGQNPNQALTPEAILQSAREVAQAGASAIHIHVRDDEGYNVLSPERFAAVIEPLHEEFPDTFVDGCLVPALDGEWAKMNEVLDSGLLDGAPINTAATYVGDSLFVKPAPVIMEKTRLILDSGSVPEIAVYTDADVSNAERFLFRSGLISSGAVWLIVAALPGTSPMNNPRQMVEGLTRFVGLIRDVDPDAIIFVCGAGRASSYLTTLAAVLGLHIRVGMEDTYYKWPHREDLITSNLESLRLAQQLAEVVGRSVATPAETRQILGANRVKATS